MANKTVQDDTLRSGSFFEITVLVFARGRLTFTLCQEIEDMKKNKSRMWRMKSPVSAIVLATMALAVPSHADVDQDDGAAQVAKAWFTSLMQGETEVTTALSGVPFSLDGKHEIATLGELKKIYDGVVEKKGKRNLKIASTKMESSSPNKVIVLITIEGDDETVSVFVKPGDAFRVIGFTD